MGNEKNFEKSSDVFEDCIKRAAKEQGVKMENEFSNEHIKQQIALAKTKSMYHKKQMEYYNELIGIYQKELEAETCKSSK